MDYTKKMAIEKHLPKALTDVLYAALSFMQKWSVMLKEEDRERFGQVKDTFLGWLKTFTSNAIAQTVLCLSCKGTAFGVSCTLRVL